MKLKYDFPPVCTCVLPSVCLSHVFVPELLFLPEMASPVHGPSLTFAVCGTQSSLVPLEDVKTKNNCLFMIVD